MEKVKNRRIAIIGAGALGVMYGNIFNQNKKQDVISFLADADRVLRYQKEGIFLNGVRQEFDIRSTDQIEKPYDLILIAVKFHQLEEALSIAEKAAGEHTIFLSVLNGISSEEKMAERFGEKNVLDCCVQGMDALKKGNQFFCSNTGTVSIGMRIPGQEERLTFVESFLKDMKINYTVYEDMKHQLWKKLMLNAGVNQASVVFDVPYGGIQKEGMARVMTIEAMKEVKRVAQYEDVFLTEEEINQWMKVIDSLNPEGMPSMRQDILAKRPTELSLFAGTIRQKGKEFGVQTPVNDYFYEGIRLMEKNRGILS
ncbi:MAG: ketopantoate reductase family protein [Lachnospiraceae bacterium]|nr:ketopantoate reductase family protein [Lachnospiraceae bacterium]